MLLSKAKGVDIREHGSGNIGATNVTRSLGKAAGRVTFIFDFLKGALPTLLLSNPPLIALCAVAGHCFSIFLKFKGGKGVATGVGALLVLAPLHALIGILVFVATYKAKKIVSLASLSACLIISTIYSLSTEPLQSKLCVIAICLIIFLRHKANIKRLLAGTET